MQDVINDPMDREHIPLTTKDVEMAPLQMPRSIIVCRAKQCAPVKLSMSKEYIYNSLVQMMENNNSQKALVCAADAGSHNCYQNYLAMPITVGITPAYMYIDSVKINDVHVAKSRQSVSMMLDYNVTYNGQSANCAPSKTNMYVRNTENIIMQDEAYRCKMTTVGSSSIKTLFLVDYIDLDYGFIGGYYSVGVSGPAYGGGSGYMLLRLGKTGYPVKPASIADDGPVKKKSSAASSYLDGKDATKQATEDGLDNGSGVQVFPVKK